MEQRSSTSRYILTALAIILVITAFILVGLNALRLQSGGGIGLSLLSQQTDQAYKDGYLAARQKYQSICPLPVATTQMIGRVLSTNSSSLKVQEQSLDTDPKVDGVDDVRTVTITSTTSLMLVVRKSAATLAAEQASATPGSPPPSVFTEQKISLADIKPGMTITVQSTQDVRLAASIAANSIIATQ